MILPHLLRVKLHTTSPDQCILKLRHYTPMKLITLILNLTLFPLNNHRLLIIRNLSLRFSIDPYQVLILPHCLLQIINPPFLKPTYRYIVRYSIKNLLFLHSNIIDLIQYIQTRDISPVSFNSIDQIIGIGITLEIKVRVCEFVLFCN